MNQILQVQENKKKKSTTTIDTKKIVFFFAVCIVIFGIIMVGQGIYSKVIESKNNQQNQPEGQIEKEPIISFGEVEGNQLIISVESEIAISHIIYDWNGETSYTIEELGKTKIEEIIDIPVGENVLNLTVIDINGKETKKISNKYIVEASKPVIETPSVIGNQEIKIVVKSEVELAYVTYKWNSETEEKYDMHTFENRKKFEKTAKIPKGQNTLKIVAVDINGNQSETSKVVEGVTPAKVPVPIVRDGYIYFSIISETYDIEKVEFELNGNKQLMNTDTFGKTKEVNWRVKMVEGWNYLKITTKLQYDKVDTTNSTYWKFENKQQ